MSASSASAYVHMKIGSRWIVWRGWSDKGTADAFLFNCNELELSAEALPLLLSTMCKPPTGARIVEDIYLELSVGTCCWIGGMIVPVDGSGWVRGAGTGTVENKKAAPVDAGSWVGDVVVGDKQEE